MIKTYWFQDPNDNRSAFLEYVKLSDHQREVEEKLVNQRRRMGQEYDDLDAKLKTIQKNATWELNDYAKSMERANKQIFQLQDKNKELTSRLAAMEEENGRLREVLALIANSVCDNNYSQCAGDLNHIAQAALEVKEC